MTATPGSPYNAGVKPTALAADPTNRFVYVTDFASNQLIGYGIYTDYTLNFLLNGPYRTGGEPSSIAIDPRGKFIYVSDSLDSSVTAYVIDLTTGTPSTAVNSTGSQTNSTDTQPVSVAVDPALGRFVYTANFLGNSVSGFRLDPIAGTLKQTQTTPYPTGIHPTAVILVPHGNHSTQRSRRNQGIQTIMKPSRPAGLLLLRLARAREARPHALVTYQFGLESEQTAPLHFARNPYSNQHALTSQGDQE